MNVYLVRFNDRKWGFTIRAIVGPSSEEECKQYCKEKFHSQFEENFRSSFAQIVDTCDVMYDKITYVEDEYEE